MAERIYKTSWFGGKQSKNRKHKEKNFNQIRIFKENGIMYFEVKLQDEYTMLCDIKYYKLLRSQIWSLFKNGNTYYCRGNNKQFHRLIYPKWSCIDHIN